MVAEWLKQQDVWNPMPNHEEASREFQRKRFVSSRVIWSVEVLLGEIIFTLPSNKQEERAKLFFKYYLELYGEISPSNGK